jgi:hypothetical protein
MLGFSEPKIGNDIVYGSAWHVFREQLALGDGTDKSIMIACDYLSKQLASPQVYIKKLKEWMTPSHLMGVCMKYIKNYGVDKSFGDFEYLKSPSEKKLVEQTFSIPLVETAKVVVLLQGTIDEIGIFSNSKCHAFGDDKTTGSYQVDDYLSSYEMKPQLLTYAWAIRWMAEHGEKDNILAQFCKERVGGFINGIFLNKDVEKVTFQRSKIFWFNDERLAFYENHIKGIAVFIAKAYLGEIEPFKQGIINGTCSGNYGRCMYWAACNAPDSTAEQAILDYHFKPKEYTPLAFRKQI